MNGERIIAGEYYLGVDPPAQTYPDGKQILRAYVTSWGLVNGPQGWYQHVAVIPGATYELAGHIWTSIGESKITYRFPIGRIGVDLDGISNSVAETDIWCATPAVVDDMKGWTHTNKHWSRISAKFTAETDYVTVYMDSMTFATSAWMGVHFDLLSLNGANPETWYISATPYPTSTPTPTPTPPGDPFFGSNWTQVNAKAPWSGRMAHAAEAFNDRIWILGGSNQRFLGKSYNDVWSSTDGANWTEEVHAAPWAARSKHSTVIYDSKLWIFGGKDSDMGVFNDVWSSTNGRTWNLVTSSAPWTPRFGQETLVHNGKIWLLGGSPKVDDITNYNDIWTTTDGVNWTEVRDHPLWYPRYDYAAVSYKGCIYLFGGIGNSDVWSSKDGSFWKLETLIAPWPGRYGHRVFVHDGKMVLAGGFTWYGDGHNDVWISSDGSSWSQVTAGAAWPVRGNHRFVEFKGKMWLLGGADNRFPAILYSDVWNAEAGPALPTATPVDTATPTPSGTPPPTNTITPTPTQTTIPIPTETPVLAAGFYMLDGWGTLWRSPRSLPAPQYGAASRGWPWFGWDAARGVAVSPNQDGFYMLDRNGVVWPSGNTLYLNYSLGGLHWFGYDVPADIEISASGRGLLVLDAHGLLWPYGDYAIPEAASQALQPYFWFNENLNIPQSLLLTLEPPESIKQLHQQAESSPPYPFEDPLPSDNRYNSNNDRLLTAEAVVLHPSGKGYYILDSYGAIHAVGDVPPEIAPSVPYFGWNIARDLALTSSGQGAWMLDGWGGIHAIGDAEPPPYSGANGLPYFPQYDIARGLQVIYYKTE